MALPVEQVPLTVRIKMAHAQLQWVADVEGVPLLHIKGTALDDVLKAPGREGSDADILVHPSSAERFCTALQRYGWKLGTRFTTGSSFEHAATLRHEELGWADVHRHYPGFGVPAEEAFEVLWRERHTVSIAGRACDVPSVAAQALILVLHAARSPHSNWASVDLQYAWSTADPGQREEVLDLVDRLDAHVGFAAATGRLESYRSHPDYLLWKVASQGGTRLEEWRARLRATPGVRHKALLVARAPLVNRDHLATVLWREPTRTEMVTEFFARPLRGIRDETRAWRQRHPRRPSEDRR